MFKNYKFEVEKIDKQIIKSYKIKEGISKQYLALDLLEKNGYNPEMIIEARKIFTELVELNNPHFLEKSVIKKHKNPKKVNETPLENVETPLENPEIPLENVKIPLENPEIPLENKKND